MPLFALVNHVNSCIKCMLSVGPRPLSSVNVRSCSSIMLPLTCNSSRRERTSCTYSSISIVPIQRLCNRVCNSIILHLNLLARFLFMASHASFPVVFPTRIGRTHSESEDEMIARTT